MSISAHPRFEGKMYFCGSYVAAFSGGFDVLQGSMTYGSFWRLLCACVSVVVCACVCVVRLYRI